MTHQFSKELEKWNNYEYIVQCKNKRRKKFPQTKRKRWEREKTYLGEKLPTIQILNAFSPLLQQKHNGATYIHPVDSFSNQSGRYSVESCLKINSAVRRSCDTFPQQYYMVLYFYFSIRSELELIWYSLVTIIINLLFIVYLTQFN